MIKDNKSVKNNKKKVFAEIKLMVKKVRNYKIAKKKNNGNINFDPAKALKLTVTVIPKIKLFFLNLVLNNLLVILLIFLAFALRTYKINETMTFIGDQGWFYLSARDLALGKSFPIIGIESSREWLHQGPLWTYMLAPVLLMSSFNPVSGAILTAILDTIAAFVFYRIGLFFNKKIALLAFLMYATSPLLIENSRAPYHTSPIPLFVAIYLYSVIKWIEGRKRFFLLNSIFFLGLLYNLELATIVFIACFTLLLFLGLHGNKSWAMDFIKPKQIIFSSMMFVIPMIPVIIYDIKHGFPQTIKFGLWTIYKLLQALNLFDKSIANFSYYKFSDFILFMGSALFFILNRYISTALLVIAIFYGIYCVFKKQLKREAIIAIYTIISIISLLVLRTPSFAYIPMLSGGCVLLLVLGLDFIEKKIKIQNLTLSIILICSLCNLVYLIINDFSIFPKNTNITFAKRLVAAKQILDFAGKERYSLTINLPGGNFDSSTMNYEYLTWWLANNPPEKKGERKINILEKNEDIIVRIE